MTSLRVTKIHDHTSDGHNFESTFKIQRQGYYYMIESLMPMPNDDLKMNRIYFMGSCEERVSTSCQHVIQHNHRLYGKNTRTT